MPSTVQRPSIFARLAAGLVRCYQLFLSPLQRLLGPGAGCRFEPSCSEYAKQALLTHGLIRGSWLGMRRLARCNPLHEGGFDAVPPGRFIPGRMWRPRVEN